MWLATLGMEVEMWGASKVGLEKAKRLATSQNMPLQTKQIDLNEADWSQDMYDMVICIVDHFPPHVREKAFAGIQKMLLPDGFFLTEVYSTHQLAYGKVARTTLPYCTPKKCSINSMTISYRSSYTRRSSGEKKARSITVNPL